jgi:hypothetical protein
VHPGRLVVSRARVQKLMNIEQVFQRKFNEVKTNYFWKLGHAFDTIGNPK